LIASRGKPRNKLCALPALLLLGPQSSSESYWSRANARNTAIALDFRVSYHSFNVPSKVKRRKFEIWSLSGPKFTLLLHEVNGFVRKQTFRKIYSAGTCWVLMRTHFCLRKVVANFPPGGIDHFQSLVFFEHVLFVTERDVAPARLKCASPKFGLSLIAA